MPVQDRIVKESHNHAVFFLTFLCLISLYFTRPAQAADEVVVANVVQSTPYYGKNQGYHKECITNEYGNEKCFLVGDMPKSYVTTFTNGREQFTMFTQVQFPHDVYFDVTRNCDSGRCVYKSAIMSQYQSPETMAIDEIIAREQQRYLNDPRRLY